MSTWTYKEVVEDWINYLDETIIPQNSYKEPGHNHKTIILDSILVFSYLREVNGNISANEDYRLQKLFEICTCNCRSDYYHRFLNYNPKYYKNNKNMWLLDCWEAIRLNNILHELDYRKIPDFFQKSLSGGADFEKKWERFFAYANLHKTDDNSLPAFSYLESCRFALNIGRDISMRELKTFLGMLCEKTGEKLKYFPRSLELRVKALSLLDKIDLIERNDLNIIHDNLLEIIKALINDMKWNSFSNSLAVAVLELKNPEITELIKTKMSYINTIESSWVSGNLYYKRKPRYALLLTINEIEKYEYFELIKPNPSLYVVKNSVDAFINISKIIDNIIQSFDENTELQRKVQNNDIQEEFFQDLLKVGLSGSKGDSFEWVEKEKMTGSGRISDVYVTMKRGPNIPIETKILWRFGQNASYNPITEVLEQSCQWNFGITLVINPKGNPTFQKKYFGFEGWRKWVTDHESFIPGTLKNSNEYFDSEVYLKTKHFYSSHILLGDRVRQVTLLNLFIDLQDYVRSPSLKSL